MGEIYLELSERRRISIMLLAVMLTINIVLYMTNVISSVPFWVTVGVVGLITLQRT